MEFNLIKKAASIDCGESDMASMESAVSKMNASVCMFTSKPAAGVQNLPPIGHIHSHHNRPAPISIPEHEATAPAMLRSTQLSQSLDTQQQRQPTTPVLLSRKRFPTLENIAALTATVVPGGASPRTFARLSEPAFGSRLHQKTSSNGQSASENSSVHDGWSVNMHELRMFGPSPTSEPKQATPSVPGSGRFRSPIVSSRRISNLFNASMGNIQDLKSRPDSAIELGASMAMSAIKEEEQIDELPPTIPSQLSFASRASPILSMPPRHSNPIPTSGTLESMNQMVILTKLHHSNDSSGPDGMGQGIESRGSFGASYMSMGNSGSEGRIHRTSNESRLSEPSPSTMLVTLIHPADVSQYYGRYHKKVDPLSPVAEGDFDEDCDNGSPWMPSLERSHTRERCTVAAKIEKSSSDISGETDDMSDILPSCDSANRDTILPCISAATGITDSVETSSESAIGTFIPSTSAQTGLTDILDNIDDADDDNGIEFASEMLVSKVNIS